MRLGRFAAFASLCLVAASVQACAFTELPERQVVDPGPWPDLGERKAAAEPEGDVLTPAQQNAAIEDLKNRQP